MHAVEHYRKLYRYDRWANGEVVRVLASAGDAPSPEAVQRAVKLLAHVVGAEWTWLARLSIPTEETAVWPEMDLGQCGRQIDLLGNVWQGYLNGASPADIEKTIEYRNSKGERWQSRVEDVLLHVAMHSAYHRGQIALEMRAAGLNPAYTDFIQATRAGAVK